MIPAHFESLSLLPKRVPSSLAILDHQRTTGGCLLVKFAHSQALSSTQTTAVRSEANTFLLFPRGQRWSICTEVLFGFTRHICIIHPFGNFARETNKGHDLVGRRRASHSHTFRTPLTYATLPFPTDYFLSDALLSHVCRSRHPSRIVQSHHRTPWAKPQPERPRSRPRPRLRLRPRLQPYRVTPQYSTTPQRPPSTLPRNNHPSRRRRFHRVRRGCTAAGLPRKVCLRRPRWYR